MLTVSCSNSRILLSKIQPNEKTTAILWDRDGDVREIPMWLWWDSLQLAEDLAEFRKAGRIDSVPEVFIMWNQTQPRLADVNVRFNPRPSIGKNPCQAG